MLRLDKLHPVVSGNKWFKLKGYLQLALQSPANPIITFGGAWSNHLLATAYAARQAGLDAIGIVRGEQPATGSATLEAASSYGMQLEFISRGEYAEKESPGFLHRLAERYPGATIIPEGGAGITGILGSEDILREIDTENYTHILCAIGTGTMLMGLLRASHPGQVVIGVPILKGIEDLPALLSSMLGRSTIDPKTIGSPDRQSRCRLLPGYHFGGYARHSRVLLDFMNRFFRETGIPSDFVYTGKLFYAITDSMHKDVFPAHSRLLIIHSGGLQGNRSLPSGNLDF